MSTSTRLVHVHVAVAVHVADYDHVHVYDHVNVFPRQLATHAPGALTYSKSTGIPLIPFTGGAM